MDKIAALTIPLRNALGRGEEIVGSYQRWLERARDTSSAQDQNPRPKKKRRNHG